ncbi:MAG: ABC transporter permease [Acidimicrobiales bacterium]
MTAEVELQALGSQELGDSPEPTASRPAVLSVSTAKRLILDYGMIWAAVITVVVCQVLFSGFLSLANIRVMLNEGAPLGIIAVGQTLVILVGGFDLSVGAVLAMTSVVYATWAQHNTLFLAGFVAMLFGLVFGLVNAALVTRFKINAFIATLATGSAIGGFSYIYSKSLPITVNKPAFATLGTANWGGVPIDAWLMLGAFVVFQLLLRYLKYGRSIYAVGGNREAARLMGLRVSALTGSCFVVSALLAGFGGLIMASHLSLGEANFSGNFALDSIAIVVIGGTTLSGGEGSIWRTAVGFVIIESITDLLNAKAVNSEWSDVVVGAILVGAVGMDYLTRRLRDSSGRRNVRGAGSKPLTSGSRDVGEQSVAPVVSREVGKGR